MIKPIIRVRSSGPLRRAGISLAPIGKWLVHELVDVAEQGLNQLLQLIEDPHIQVQLGEPKPGGGPDDYVWSEAPPADYVRAILGSDGTSDGITAAVAAITPEHETLMRELLEANMRAIREGRLDLPGLDYLRQGIAHYNGLPLLMAQADPEINPASERVVAEATAADTTGPASADSAPPAPPTGTTDTAGAAEGTVAQADQPSEAQPTAAPQNAATDPAPIAPVKAAVAPKPKAPPKGKPGK